MKKILIVEDEMIIADMHQDIVEAGGNEVVGIAGTGQKAIRLFKELSPDLILMDIYLADETDGIETMEIIRQKSQVPVIYITGNSEDQTRKRAEKTGYAAYLKKPVEPDILTAAIKRVFEN